MSAQRKFARAKRREAAAVLEQRILKLKRQRPVPQYIKERIGQAGQIAAESKVNENGG
jgi:hypothetical protein